MFDSCLRHGPRHPSPLIVTQHHFSPFQRVLATLSIHVIRFESCLTHVKRHPSPPIVTQHQFHHIREFKPQFIFMSSCLTAVWDMSRVIRHHPLIPNIILHLFREFKPHFYSCHHVWQLFDTCLASSVTIHCYPTSFFTISESLSHTFYSCHHVW